MSPKLIEITSGILGVAAEELNPDSSPKTLPQWTSLAHVTIVAALEQECNVMFEMSEILSIKSLGDLDRLLAAKS